MTSKNDDADDIHTTMGDIHASHIDADKSISGVQVRTGLQIWLLGGFRVSVHSQMIADQVWQSQRKVRALLQLLALSPGHRRHSEQVMEALWPEAEHGKAMNNLHRILFDTRRVLEPGLTSGAESAYLQWQDDHLVLRSPDHLWVDATTFEARCKEARKTKDPAHYTDALALYTDDLLPQDVYVDWIASHRDRLRLLHLDMLREMAQLHLARREILLAIQVLERLVVRDPFQEDMQRELMRLYAVSGQRYQARRSYQQLKEALAKDEWAPDPLTTTLYNDIGTGRIAPDPSLVIDRKIPMQQPSPAIVLDKQRTNLSSHAAPFIGRQKEIEAVEVLLSTTRLLTLTGPGGCGKTRLAEQVAQTCMTTYSDGVWLVALAPVTDSHLVPQAVAIALGIQEHPGQPLIETLVNELQSKHMLLLLDNCEHQVQTCAQLITTLLESCPRLTVLATSRRPLKTLNETIWRIPLLSTPDPERLPPLEELPTYDAIQFFLERAGAMGQTFHLTSQNAPAIVAICHRLDGIALAIELAARRVQVASVDQIAVRLDDCFAALAPAKGATLSPHQTLQMAIDWSHSLLSPAEQVLFRRLSVFAGGWMLEEAEQVCVEKPGGQRKVLGWLSELVDASMVETSPCQNSSKRYRLLEVIRQYSEKKCRAAGEWKALCLRHAACYLQLAETAEPALFGTDQETWLNRLEAEHENLLAALRRANERKAAAYEVRLAGALWRFWHQRGYLSEGLDVLKRALAGQSEAGSISASARAKALNGAGILTYLLGDVDQAVAFYEEALTLYRATGEKLFAAAVLSNLGMVAHYQGEHERALALYGEALALSRQSGDDWRTATVLNNLGMLLKDQGRYREATPLTEESLALFRKAGDLNNAAGILNNLAILLMMQGEFAQATVLFEESVAQLRQKHHKMGILDGLQNLARLAQRQGQYERARQVLQETLSLSQELKDEWGLAEELYLLGLCAYGQSNYQEAQECYQQSLRLQRKVGWRQEEAAVLIALGTLHAVQERFLEARTHYEQGLRLGYQVHDRAIQAEALEGLAALAAAQDNPLQAARLFGAAAALREETGAILPPCNRSRYDQHLERAQACMDEVSWEHVWQAGQSLLLTQLLPDVLMEADDKASPDPEKQQDQQETWAPEIPQELPSKVATLPEPGSLSPRERQVASLLAQRLTNREIAERLTLSPRTVDTHVTNILGKLRLKTREQVRTWAIAHGLIEP
ncbi:hypothetical protein KSD_57060 [Ktedonobacter sp. SOSP1-85]|uniref:tetratricopeptide repeat protein n=1 Tax=Ktedonobacter sp. SOSP1-85 TaxID=2778367 RepID=UPI00191601D6|nr:tetratricopeptide repeat protein [Ktedonobacter sp. SOSP1-85]GHO77935.1 hypothetical protein KSD_57060 [Ktedonobacter sp. SOSP1-85]